MNQLLSRLPEAQTKLFFGVLILFAAITVYFSPLLAAIEILITALLLVYHLLTRRSREQKVHRLHRHPQPEHHPGRQGTMTNSPFPMVIFRPENGEVIWSNDRFLDLCSDRDHIFDTTLPRRFPSSPPSGSLMERHSAQMNTLFKDAATRSLASWSAWAAKIIPAMWPPPTGWM